MKARKYYDSAYIAKQLLISSALMILGTGIIGYEAFRNPMKDIPLWQAVIGASLLWFSFWVMYLRITHGIIQNMKNLDGVLYFIVLSIVFMLQQIFLFANLYKSGQLRYEGQLATSDYVYFSAITWTTVGYGDITPTANTRIIAGLEAIAGYLFMGVFISILGSLIWTAFGRKLETERKEIQLTLPIDDSDNETASTNKKGP